MQIGDKIQFDRYEWRVLEVQSGRALLITEFIVEQRPYNNYVGETVWADCELRTYLNGEFYNEFSEENRVRILPVENINPSNPWYGAEGGENTTDHIFILSIDEAVRKYFGDSSANIENRSAKQRYWFQKKDINNDSRRAITSDEEMWWWWLRTPGRDNKRAVYIHGDGNIGIQGNKAFKYSSTTIHPATGDNSGGVRPALWVRI